MGHKNILVDISSLVESPLEMGDNLKNNVLKFVCQDFKYHCMRYYKN